MIPISAQIEGIELLILLVIVAALLLLGPRYISPLFKGLGRAMGEFQKGKMEVQKEIEEMQHGPQT